MTILNESGVPDVLSPLYGVGNLGDALPNALILVVGTRTEAYVTQSLLGTLAPRNPRVMFVVLEPGEEPEQGSLAARIVHAASNFRRTQVALILMSYSAQVLGIDANFEARLASRRLSFPVRATSLGSGEFTTGAEDEALAALVDLCPGTAPEEHVSSVKRGSSLLGGILSRGGSEGRGHRIAARPVALLGLTPRENRKELTEALERAGVEVVGVLPSVKLEELPPLDTGIVAATIGPYPATASRAVAERGVEVVKTLMPLGVDGTARFVQDVAVAAGSSSEVREVARAREYWENLSPLRNRIRGRRIFLTGDTGLEIPLARTLVDAGAVVLEVGTPRLHRSFLSAELQALGTDIDVVEGPEWTKQIERIDEVRPHLVITSPGLYAPLVARGHLCRSSLDFLQAGIYGYEGARRLLELFARTLDRAEELDSLKL